MGESRLAIRSSYVHERWVGRFYKVIPLGLNSEELYMFPTTDEAYNGTPLTTTMFSHFTILVEVSQDATSN